MSLNAKQQRFVEEYILDLNATQAAIRAGYSPKTAEVTGCKLLRNAKVAAAIQEGIDRVPIDDALATTEWIAKRH